MKYIIYTRDYFGVRQEIPIIFPNQLVHLEVAKALKSVVGSSKIVAAGEFSSLNIDSDGFIGKSTTIGIRSRGKRDGKLIAMFDYKQGLD
jgi:hypothetical protein